jgi:hypothetical protein
LERKYYVEEGLELVQLYLNPEKFPDLRKKGEGMRTRKRKKKMMRIRWPRIGNTIVILSY